MTIVAPASRRARRAFDLVVDDLRGVRPRLSLALAVNGAIPPFGLGRVRIGVLRIGGLRIGPRTTVGGRMWVAGGPSPTRSITIGADCFLNDGCRFDTSAPITIGDDVYMGHEVAIITSSHDIGAPSRRATGSISAPVEVGAGTWIGARATVLPGVSIGPGAIVGAGAIVTRSVDADTLVAGVPARLVRKLEPFEPAAGPRPYNAEGSLAVSVERSRDA